MFSFLQRATQTTVGSRFRDICVVGLNRVELALQGEAESVFGNHWEDVTDEQSRRNMALLFFAPRELDGTPEDAYLFLADDENDPDAKQLTEQELQGIPLLDMCRMPVAEPGQLHLLVAADVIFHWDSKGCYVVPTNKYNWVRDVRQIVKEYPKNIAITLYTNWETDGLTELKVDVRTLRHLPLQPEVWINTPTFQEKSGTSVLVAAIAFVVLTWGGLYMQGTQMEKLDESIRITQQKIPREGRFVELNRYMSEQEKFTHYREMFPWLVADVAYALEKSGMKFDSFKVENPTPQDPTDVFVSTIEASKNAYKGWLEEEPISKAVMLNSLSLAAIRKPPGNSFKLEGLMPLKPLYKDFTSTRRVMQEEDQRRTPAPAPTTTQAPAREGADS